MTTEQGLLIAVQNLTAVVRALDATIRDEYPKRKEVERRFATKKESRDRLALAFIALGLGLVSSFFVTTSTLSYCFLSGAEVGRKIHTACQLIPGYKESVDTNEAIIAEFRELQQVTNKNSKRLDELEKRRKR